MFRIKTYFAFLTGAFLFSSCTTDFQINADWKEIPIVYGLLDRNDTTHYIRIGKAFIDPNTDAFTLAAIQDSLYFNGISPVMEEYVNNNLTRSFNLVEDNSISMDTGIFSNPSQVLYRFNTLLNTAATYKLTFVTPLGERIETETPIIDRFTLDRPRRNDNLNWSNPSGVRMEFRSPVNAKTYEIKARVHIEEYRRPNPNLNVTKRFLEFNVTPTRYFNSANGGQLNTLFIQGRSIFNLMNEQLEVSDTIGRRFRGVEFILLAGGEELANYIQINQPNQSTLVQTKPEYTNVLNGFGIFSTRYQFPAPESFPPYKPLERFTDPNYPANSLTYTIATQGVALDSLLLNYPQLNFDN